MRDSSPSMKMQYCMLAPTARFLVAVAVASIASGAPATVTFYRDIAPIMYRNCATCHRPGESGPFSLLTYEDAKKRAAQIAAVTKRRFMPPWLPEAGRGNFVEERRLSDGQIDAIQEWVKEGAPAGLPSEAPPAPKFTSEWQLGRPDLVLRVAKPYPTRGGRAGGLLEFHNSRADFNHQVGAGD